MTSGETLTESMVADKEQQMHAINSLTTALKVSGMNRALDDRADGRDGSGRLTNGDPAPLMLWGEDW